MATKTLTTTYEKNDDYTMKIVKPVYETVSLAEMIAERDARLSAKVERQTRKEEMDLLDDTRISELNDLIAEAESIGIIVEQPVVEEIIEETVEQRVSPEKMKEVQDIINNQ